jgi:hypothetical protein
MDMLENQIHIREITPTLIAEYLSKKPEYKEIYEIMIHEG